MKELYYHILSTISVQINSYNFDEIFNKYKNINDFKIVLFSTFNNMVIEDSIIYIRNRKLHDEINCSWIKNNFSKTWFLNNKIHREKYPAIIKQNCILYKKFGMDYNILGPSGIFFYKEKVGHLRYSKYKITYNSNCYIRNLIKF